MLFDLDGTLVDTAPDLIHSLNIMLEENGKPWINPDLVRPHISGGANAIIAKGLGEDINSDAVASCRSRYLEIYHANLSVHSRLFPGMEDVLSYLEDNDKLWGIVTNKPGYLTEPLLEQMNLSWRCCAIISADTVAHKKPHPLPMLEACKRCSIHAADCIYVGDDTRDMEAGNAAGMVTLAAAWGYYLPDDRIESWPAQGVVLQPLDLLDWI